MQISVDKLKNLAETTIAKDGSIDITLLANKLNIDVYEYDFENEISGAVSKPTNEIDSYAIFVSDNDPITRQRFSIAHELAHMALHPDILKEEGVLHRSKYDKSKIEEEANKLAEELLMPESLVIKFLEIFDLNKNSTITAKTIETISKKFKVSKYVAIIRLRNLDYNVPYIYYA